MLFNKNTKIINDTINNLNHAQEIQGSFISVAWVFLDIWNFTFKFWLFCIKKFLYQPKIILWNLLCNAKLSESYPKIPIFRKISNGAGNGYWRQVGLDNGSALFINYK